MGTFGLCATKSRIVMRILFPRESLRHGPGITACAKCAHLAHDGPCQIVKVADGKLCGCDGRAPEPKTSGGSEPDDDHDDEGGQSYDSTMEDFGPEAYWGGGDGD